MRIIRRDVAPPVGDTDPSSPSPVEERHPTAAPEPSRGRFSAPLRRLRGPLALVAVATVLALAGAGFLARSVQLRDVPAADNRALVDRSATTRVIGDVSNALTKIFSYSPGNLAATDRAADRVLTGKASEQYNRLFTQVRQRAAEQELTLKTGVVAAGVTRLDGDRAQLLVFLDQTYTRGGDQQTSAAAQLLVSTQRRNGQWLISGIEPR